MKKKISVLLAVLCAVVLVTAGTGFRSSAGGAKVSITADTGTIKKEEQVQVTVTVSCESGLQSVDTMVDYDPEILEYISADSGAVVGATGTIHILEEFADPEQTVTYTLTFQALEIGSVSVTVYDTYVVEAQSLSVIGVAADAVSIEVAANQTESKESRLSELVIAPGSLTQEFDPDIYAYTAEVSYEDEVVVISASAMDEEAVISMDKPETFSVGENLVTITVTAPSGDASVYTITVVRDGQAADAGQDELVQETDTTKSDETSDTGEEADRLDISDSTDSDDATDSNSVTGEADDADPSAAAEIEVSETETEDLLESEEQENSSTSEDTDAGESTQTEDDTGAAQGDLQE